MALQVKGAAGDGYQAQAAHSNGVLEELEWGTPVRSLMVHVKAPCTPAVDSTGGQQECRQLQENLSG